MKDFNQLIIDESETIYLDGVKLNKVTKYELSHTAVDKTAELTITLEVNVGQVGM